MDAWYASGGTILVLGGFGWWMSAILEETPRRGLFPHVRKQDDAEAFADWVHAYAGLTIAGALVVVVRALIALL